MKTLAKLSTKNLSLKEFAVVSALEGSGGLRLDNSISEWKRSELILTAMNDWEVNLLTQEDFKEALYGTVAKGFANLQKGLFTISEAGRMAYSEWRGW